VPLPIVPIPPQRVVIPVGDNQNATLMMRLAVPLADSDADYPALMMANHLLGAGGNSRLWKRIREGEGLSYDVRGEIGWSNEEPHSEWHASAIFAPQNLGRVEAAFKEELARALRDGFTAQELAEGQRGLLNFRRLGRAQDAAIASQLAANLHLGRTMALSARVDDALARLTVAKVNAALRKYIVPERFIAAAAGDFKELKP
jgi:zinc protease